MTQSAIRDINFLAARLHGRRSALAEGARLDELCRLRTVGELCHALEIEAGSPPTADAFQRRVLADYADELRALAEGVPAEYAAFFEWQRYRFHVENAKVVLRGLWARRPTAEINARLVGESLPDDFQGPADLPADPVALARMTDLDPCILATVAGAAEAYARLPSLFTLESLLDAGYLAELLRRAARCRGDEGGVRALAGQEAATFLTMLALRGAGNYRLPADLLGAFYVEGAPLSRAAFARLAAASPDEAPELVAGIAFDALPPGAGVQDVEAACWGRYLRLANGLFRRGHMNVAAVAGFLGIRRIEVANLITLSEGLRLGMDGHALRARLIPRET